MPDYAPYDSAKQALGTLSAALFPDPNKVAAAGYAGAEQRAAMLKGNQIIDQGNAANYGLGLTPGSGVAPAPPTFFTPSGSPQGAPRVMAPPSTLPAAPGQPPSLSATVAPSAPPGGAPPPPPSISPAQATDLIATGTGPNPQGVGTSGTPPPASSPAPNSGAPPAPNTTGSDGSTPANDAASATLHPGSFQAPGGGVKYAPPAQADGSPSPVAFNPALYVAMMTRAGYNADQVRTMGAAYVMQALRQGVIDQSTANQLLAGFGETGPLTAQTQIMTTSMNNRTELAKQGMVTGENAREFNLTPVMTTPTPGAAPVYTPRIQAPGKLAYDAPFSTQYNTPVTTQPGGPTAPGVFARQGDVTPGTPVFNQPLTEQARTLVSTQPTPTSPPVLVPQANVPPGTPAFNTDVYKQATSPVPVVDTQTNQSTVIPYNDYINAPAGRYVPAPKELSPTEALQRQALYDQAPAEAFPGISNNIVGVRNETAHLGPADELQFTTLANQKMVTGPPGVRGNAKEAGRAALKELQDQGVIRKSIDRQAKLQLYNDHIISQPTDKGGVLTYYQVPTLAKEPEAPPPLSTTVTTPSTAAPTATAPPPTDTSTASTGGVNLGSIFTRNPFGGGGGAQAAPAPTPTAPPPGAVMPAPPGTQDGQTITGNNGRQLVARGGYFFPVAPQSAIQGR